MYTVQYYILYNVYFQMVKDQVDILRKKIVKEKPVSTSV